MEFLFPESPPYPQPPPGGWLIPESPPYAFDPAPFVAAMQTVADAFQTFADKMAEIKASDGTIQV